MVHEQSKKNECTCICQTLFPSYKLHIALYTSVLPHIKFMRTITNMHASYCAANLTVLCTETLCVCESMCVCVCVCACACVSAHACAHTLQHTVIAVTITISLIIIIIIIRQYMHTYIFIQAHKKTLLNKSFFNNKSGEKYQMCGRGLKPFCCVSYTLE